MKTFLILLNREVIPLRPFSLSLSLSLTRTHTASSSAAIAVFHRAIPPPLFNLNSLSGHLLLHFLNLTNLQVLDLCSFSTNALLIMHCSCAHELMLNSEISWLVPSRSWCVRQDGERCLRIKLLRAGFFSRWQELTEWMLNNFAHNFISSIRFDFENLDFDYWFIFFSVFFSVLILIGIETFFDANVEGKRNRKDR